MAFIFLKHWGVLLGSITAAIEKTGEVGAFEISVFVWCTGK
jgi:hypothetical protein